MLTLKRILPTADKSGRFTFTILLDSPVGGTFFIARPTDIRTYPHFARACLRHTGQLYVNGDIERLHLRDRPRAWQTLVDGMLTAAATAAGTTPPTRPSRRDRLADVVTK